MLVRHIAGLRPGVIERGKIPAADPHEGEHIKVFVLVEAAHCPVKLLQRGIVPVILEDVNLLVVQWIGSRAGIGWRDLLIELARHDDDVEGLLA
jgi:hypothetical protein